MFINGLNSLIAKKAKIQTYLTLDDIYKLALKVETQKKEKKVFSKPFTEDLTS